MSFWVDDDRDERRSFPLSVKQHIFLEQGTKCAICGVAVGFAIFEFHHIKAHSDGGRSTKRNCIGLCPNCHTKVTKKLIKPDFKQIKEKMASHYDSAVTTTKTTKVKKAPTRKTLAKKSPVKRTATKTRKPAKKASTGTRKTPVRKTTGRKKRPATRSRLRSRA